MSLWIDQIINLLMEYGIMGLAILSFTESSFFPIPPDSLLIPLSVLNPNHAFFYAFIPTMASVIGGLFGYLIGEKAGRPIMRKFFKDKSINKVESYFNKYGGWTVLIAGLTPVPYKLFNITAGVFQVKKSVFIAACIFGRGVRFFIEASILYFMAENAKTIIAQYFDVITVGLTLFLVIIYLIYRYVTKKHKKLFFFVKMEKLSPLLKTKNKGSIFKLGKVGFYMISGLASAAVITFVFALFQYSVVQNKFANFDKRLYALLHSVQSYYIYDLVNIFYALGTLLCILIILLAVAMYFYSKHTRMTETMLMIINLTGAFALNDIFINTLNPYGGEYSLIDFSFYGILLYLFIINYKNKFKFLLGFLISIIPILTGLSRIYSGIYLASGIISGALCAAIWIIICIMIHKTMVYYDFDKW